MEANQTSPQLWARITLAPVPPPANAFKLTASCLSRTRRCVRTCDRSARARPLAPGSRGLDGPAAFRRRLTGLSCTSKPSFDVHERAGRGYLSSSRTGSDEATTAFLLDLLHLTTSANGFHGDVPPALTSSSKGSFESKGGREGSCTLLQRR